MLKKILFFVVMILYIAVPFYMIQAYNQVLNEGHIYRFKPQPVDPYDAFRGKYITLYFIQTSISYDTSECTFHTGDNVYLKVEKDSLGYATFTKAYKDAPKDADYIKTVVRYAWNDGTKEGGGINFDLPFNRYYLPEEMAAKAEALYFENIPTRTNGTGSTNVYLDVRLKDGKALIEELYFQGVPVKEFIHQQENKKDSIY